MRNSKLLAVLLVASLTPASIRAQRTRLVSPPAPAPLLHPAADRLQTLYQQSQQAFFTALSAGRLDQVPKGDSFGAPPAATWLPPGAPVALGPEFFTQLSALYRGSPLHAGLQASTGSVADLRATSFFAPFATEFMGMWSGFDGTPGWPATPGDALREITLQAGQLTQLGVGLVKLWYPFQAWMYRYQQVGGTTRSLSLTQVLRVLGDAGLDVVVTLGNSYGDGSLQTGPEDQMRFACYSQTTPGVGLPMPGTGYRMVLLDRDSTRGASFYGFPGNDYLQLLDCAQFDSFRTGEWTQYVNRVLDEINAASGVNVRALQIWNEPDGSRCPFPETNACVPPPPNLRPNDPNPCVTVPHRVARLMKAIKDQLALPARAALQARLPLMVGCGGTASMLLFAQVFDAPGTGVEPGFLRDQVRWYGFHPTATHMFQGGDYNATGAAAGAVFPGWPPGLNQPETFLKKSGNGLASEIGVNDSIGQFLIDFPATALVIEEAAMRGIMPQVLTDVDQALRDGEQNTAAIGPFVAAPAQGHSFAITLADGSWIVPREELVMQDRWRLGGAGHDAASFQGTGLAGRKVHDAPAGVRFSRSLRPLLLASPATTGGAQTQLLVAADAYDDVPTHAHVGTYPPSARPGARHRIWVRAVRSQGSTETETALVPLDTVVTNAQWASLTEDPAFKDIDDSVTPSGWPTGLVPTRAMDLAMDPLVTFWLNPPVYRGPYGETPIDLTFGGLGTLASTVPIPANPVGWPGYREDLPAFERELMLRGVIAGALRARYTGVSGRVKGTYLREERHANGEVTHHFALAFHRIVWKRDGITEDYGPADRARTDPDPVRAWSNNYGDVFAHKKDRAVSDPVHPPGKLEIVVVDVAVRDTAGVLGLSGRAEILPTVGEHVDAAAGVTNPGAEAIDPELAAADDGTLVIAYRKSQDPLFQFPEPTAGTRPWSDTNGGMLFGRVVPGGTGLFLPVLYPAMRPLKGSWASMLQSPDFRLWLFPFELYLRLRSPAGTWSAEERLSEPALGPSGPGPRPENWQQWVDTVKDLENRSAALRLLKQGGGEPYFHQDWVHADTQLPSLYLYNPHTWHPALHPTLSVSDRDNGNLTVAVAWSQYPGSQRLRPRSDQIAYVARGVEFTFDAANTRVSVSGWNDFGSMPNYQSQASTGSPIGASVRGVVSVLHREGAEPAAVFQQGERVIEGQGSRQSYSTQPGEPVRLRLPLAATTPRQHPDVGAATELELSASMAPINSSTVQSQLRVRTTMPGRGFSRDVAVPGTATSDPAARVVAVIPRARVAADVAPPTGESLAMAHDWRRGVTVLFAGTSRQTWEWDGYHWTRRTPANSPSTRSGHLMAYDRVRGRVVLLGGQYTTFPPLRVVRLVDTWEYDGTNWAQSASTGPTAFDSGAMVWDEGRQQCVAFVTGDTPQISPWFSSTCWAWNGSAWVQHSIFNLPGNGGTYPERFGLAYDFIRHRLVLFGGFDRGNTSAPLADTWEYDGTAWVRQNPAHRPPARGGMGMVYDMVQGRVVMNGGVGFQDTWVWDGSDWTQGPAAGPGGGMMVFEVQLLRSFLFTGTTHHDYANGVWTNVDPVVPFGRVVWLADGTVWWAEYDWLADRFTVDRANGVLPGPFPAAQTEASATGAAVLWTHDGALLTRRY